MKVGNVHAHATRAASMAVIGLVVVSLLRQKTKEGLDKRSSVRESGSESRLRLGLTYSVK